MYKAALPYSLNATKTTPRMSIRLVQPHQSNFYAVYAILKVHKVHKKQAYRIEKSLFFLRPFYVLSPSFLRNVYMEVQKLHILYIFGSPSGIKI